MIEKKIIVSIPVAVLLGTVLNGCDEIGDCQDAGGRWVEEIGECECTYEDRGNYDIHITDEELKACMKPRPSKNSDKLDENED